MLVKYNLTKAQVKGIKNYLKEVAGIERPTQKDIQAEITGILDTTFQSQVESMADYIRIEEQKEKNK